MNEEINSWLNSARNYQEGVALYVKYGSSSTQKRLLQKSGESKKNVDIVVYELGKLLHTTRSVSVVSAPERKVVIKQKEQRKAPVFVPKIQHEGRRPNTPEVDQLKESIKDKLKVLSSLHSSLEYLETDEKRKEASEQIITLDAEIHGLYENMRHYDEHGVLPLKKVAVVKESKPVSSMSIDELYQRKSTLKTYVSRYKIRAQNAKTEKSKVKNEQLHDKYVRELSEVANKLKNK